MASQQNPAAGQTADGASCFVQAALLNDPEDNKPNATFQRLGDVSAQVVAQLRRQRAAEHLHRCGARTVYEALLEVERGEPLDTVLERYARLTPEILRATGSDRFAVEAPMRVPDFAQAETGDRR